MAKSRIALLALVSVCSSFAFAGCSAQSGSQDQAAEEANLQRVEFNLVADGAELTSVAYVISDSTGAEVKSGTFEVPVADGSFSAFVRLPVGTGYNIALTGSGTVDGETAPCAGNSDFDVASGVSTPVAVALVCTVAGGVTTPATGSAAVTATLSVVREPSGECGITHAVIGPLKQEVGAPIALQSMYVAPSSSGSVLWTSTLTGSFVDASADNGSFTCTAPGTGSITVTLTGDAGCTDTVSAAVECVGVALPPVCGNGILEAGEDCTTCAADYEAANGADSCVVPPVCGNGLLEAGEDCTTCAADYEAANGADSCAVPPVCGNGIPETGEECDDSNVVSGDGCSATCVVEFCGDGIINNGEQCDDGVATATCSATCTTIAPPVCGDGNLDAGEDCATCEADVVASGGTCTTGPTNACGDCIGSSAVLDANGIASYQAILCGTDPAAPCGVLQICIADSGCFGRTPGANDASDCYCGEGVDPQVCVDPNYVPTGACAAQMQAAAGVTLANQTMLESYFDTNNYPALGGAFALINYARQFGECTTECGLDK